MREWSEVTQQWHCPGVLLSSTGREGSCCPSTHSVHRSCDSPCTPLTVGCDTKMLGLRVCGRHFGSIPTKAVHMQRGWLALTGFRGDATSCRGQANENSPESTALWTPNRQPRFTVTPKAAQRQVRPFYPSQTPHCSAGPFSGRSLSCQGQRPSKSSTLLSVHSPHMIREKREPPEISR